MIQICNEKPWLIDQVKDMGLLNSVFSGVKADIWLWGCSKKYCAFKLIYPQCGDNDQYVEYEIVKMNVFKNVIGRPTALYRVRGELSEDQKRFIKSQYGIENL